MLPASYRGEVKIALYTDPTSKDTGAIRFIPASHVDPLNADLHESGLGAESAQWRGKEGHSHEECALGCRVDEVPSWVVETTPGDLVCFQENCWHSTFGGKRGRLQMAISFHSAPRDAAETAYISALIDGYKFATHPNERLRASPRPRIQDMIRVPVELGAALPQEMPTFVCETQ